VASRRTYGSEPTHQLIADRPLGLDPNGAAASPGGPVAYWGVPDIDTAFRRLREHGADERAPIQEVGEGSRTATVTDPFGNAIGLIQNSHFAVTDVR